MCITTLKQQLELNYTEPETSIVCAGNLNWYLVFNNTSKMQKLMHKETYKSGRQFRQLNIRLDLSVQPPSAAGG